VLLSSISCPHSSAKLRVGPRSTCSLLIDFANGATLENGLTHHGGIGVSALTVSDDLGVTRQFAQCGPAGVVQHTRRPRRLAGHRRNPPSMAGTRSKSEGDVKPMLIVTHPIRS
jgi:hypothetical protein